MHIEQIDTHAADWQQELDTLYQQLGGSQNATLLPYHFLQAAFPYIGGKVARVVIAEQVAVVVFLLPHIAAVRNGTTPDRAQTATSAATTVTDQAHADQNRIAYVARVHVVEAAATDDATHTQPDAATLTKALARLFAIDPTAITLYDPTATHTYIPTTHSLGALEIGRPDATEAGIIRLLQQSIWGSPPEYLYPVDIHSHDFPLGTSLIARVAGEVAGFLFGFYKAGGPPLPGDWHERWHGELRLESQVMGVLPEHRGLRIGYLLKRIQAEQALAQGIGVIHWTVDPLQYPNAALNFGLLRAVAFSFTPDYYAFRNELNRGSASRFSLTWLIGSARVQAIPLHDARSTVLQLDHHPDIVRVNEGREQLDFSATAPMLAIEIPANWTQLQQQAPEEALAWRTATDQLFAHYIGSEPGQYVVTDVGVAANRRFLIIQQATDYLWQRLEET